MPSEVLGGCLPSFQPLSLALLVPNKKIRFSRVVFHDLRNLGVDKITHNIPHLISLIRSYHQIFLHKIFSNFEPYYQSDSNIILQPLK